MKLTEFLSEATIRQGVLLSSKKRALELAGKVIAEAINQENPEQNGICPIECFGNLFKREKLGSTSIANGVAFPHAKLPHSENMVLNKPVATFLQLETPIDYESNDNKEIDLIYAIMIPENCCEQYREGLKELAQRLSDKNLAKQLRSANSAEEIWQILEYADNQTMK